MKNIVIWYNRNRKSIWKIIGVIAVTIIVVQLIQYVWKQTQIAESKTYNQNSNTIANIVSNLGSISLQDEKSTVSGEKISAGQVSLLETLDTFVDYCNNGKINEAYNLLSEDCKSQMYPKVENFKNNYYNKIFVGKAKNISVENWTGNIYKVKFMNDALSTGVYEEENTIQDYITFVVDNEGNVKLNINNYIGKEEINKEKEAYGINVKVVERHKYMDYETYTFEITNNSEATILINDKDNMETMYLQDSNDIKYKAYVQEISEAGLKILSKEMKKVTIKYYSKYGSSKTIKEIIFSKVILNYEDYSNRQTQVYNNYGIIQISL